MRAPKLVVIWSRFGPYHLARLRGAAVAMPNWRVIGLEIAGDDRDYAWARADGAGGFERVTVFAEGNYHDLPASTIAAGVRAALDRIRPDAIAINGWGVPEGRAALGWARRHGARAILMSESKADDRTRTCWKEAAKRVIVRRFDAALVGGRVHADYLMSLGFPADRIQFGYDAIDNDYFEAGADRARAHAPQVRAKLALPERYFFACTRFLARKNVDGLLRGYAAYRAHAASPWSLVIAGSGEEEEALRRLAGELAIADAVHWPGFVQYPDLPAYFGLAGAFVHPAKAEAWGLVVNEAAASAVPLLVSRSVGAASELVRDGETGLLFDPGEDTDIARALTAIAAAPEESRAGMGRNARALVSHWGPAMFGAELAALIAEAPSQRTPRFECS